MKNFNSQNYLYSLYLESLYDSFCGELNNVESF